MKKRKIKAIAARLKRLYGIEIPNPKSAKKKIKKLIKEFEN